MAVKVTLESCNFSTTATYVGGEFLEGMSACLAAIIRAGTHDDWEINTCIKSLIALTLNQESEEWAKKECGEEDRSVK